VKPRSGEGRLSTWSGRMQRARRGHMRRRRKRLQVLSLLALQFTCFTRTKVQALTPELAAAREDEEEQRRRYSV
jgi:hypothetical protein